jgi:hypothetical protein
MLMKFIIEDDIEKVILERIQKALNNNVEIVAQTVSEKVNIRIGSLENFMPIEPIVNRTNAFDQAEIKVRELLKDGSTYDSFGITAKYAVLRISELVSKNQLKKAIDIRIFVAHPQWIRDDLVSEAETKRRELVGSLSALAKVTNRRFTVYFVAPVPAFRVDRIDGDAIVFMYNDTESDAGRLPDAGRYSKGNYWFKSMEAFLSDERTKALVTWEVGGELRKLDGATGKQETIKRSSSFDDVCEFFSIDAEERTASEQTFELFLKDMAQHDRRKP